MNFRAKSATAIAVAGMLGVGAAGATATNHRASDDSRRYVAALHGYEETPAVSTRARGTFRATLSGDRIAWTLRFSGIEGGAVAAAHIHFAQRDVAGGVSAFLCSGAPTPPAGVAACPANGTTLRGTLEREDVTGPVPQGIAPGQLGELVRAMNAGMTYVNVHSAAFPNGEIRGQVRHRR